MNCFRSREAQHHQYPSPGGSLGKRDRAEYWRWSSWSLISAFSAQGICWHIAEADEMLTAWLHRDSKDLDPANIICISMWIIQQNPNTQLWRVVGTVSKSHSCKWRNSVLSIISRLLFLDLGPWKALNFF